MYCYKKSIPSLVHGINCPNERCEFRKPRIDRCQDMVNSYKLRTSPEYMANQHNPLSYAFKLTREIRSQKKENIEVKSELKELYEKSRKFTFDLLDVCENNQEVAVLLNFDENDSSNKKKIETLMEAVAAKHKEFVGHRHVQQLLHSIVYPDWLYINMEFLPAIIKYVLLHLYPLTFPFWAFVFVSWRKSGISWFGKMRKFLATPFGKFANHVFHYFAFIILLFYATAKDYGEPSKLDYLPAIFVWPMCFQRAVIFWKDKCCWRCCCYFHNRWNWVLILMLIGFLVSELLWFIGGWPVDKLEIASDVPGHNILLVANSLFSISTIISVFYLGSFWTVHSMGGPLQISSLRMFKDIRNFLVTFFVIFVAFTLGVWNVYSFRNTLEAVYVNSNDTVAKQQSAEDMGSFSQSWQQLFWALFDQTNVENFETTNPRFGITTKTGKFMFAIYLISVVLVGLNLLIAMMNNSYEYVANDRTALNWKMEKTALWLDFAQKDDYILPPPYYILQIFIYVYKRCKGKAAKKMGIYDRELDDNTQNRKRILQQIIDRYRKRKAEEQLQNKNGPQELFYESNV